MHTLAGLSSEPFFVSLSTVAIAEVGDRTQLLTLMLAARYGRPWAILAGVLIATLANHLVAGLLGAHLGPLLTPRVLDTAVGVSLLAMGVWALKPERAPQEPAQAPAQARFKGATGAFVATLIAFFIAEIGDRTQLATVALAAAYSSVLTVVAGTSAGMLLANVPAAFLGQAFAQRLPMRTIHLVASVAFLLTGALFLARALRH